MRYRGGETSVIESRGHRSSLPRTRSLGFITCSCPTNVLGAGTRDEPLRTSAWDANIDATKNNAIEHFLYVESFRDEQKICLNLVRQGQDVFAILPTGSGRETLIF